MIRFLLLTVVFLVSPICPLVVAQSAGPGSYVVVRSSAATEQEKTTADLQQIARRMLSRAAVSLGVSPANFRYNHQTTAPGGQSYVHFDQHHAGYPILGARLSVAISADGASGLLSGNPVPATRFSPPTPPPADAEGEPRAWAFTNPWRPTVPRLCRISETVDPADGREYRRYTDLETGELVFRHSLDCSLRRRLYHGTSSGRNLVWREGDNYPGNLTAADREMLLASAETYHLYHRTFGRDSYDGNGGQLRNVAEATLRNCPGAQANRSVIRICPGVMADDVVAHEWTHNYLYHQNGLLYAFESGAINEAYADIFGELVDILNDRGLDTNDDQPRTGCDDGNFRWLIAEDAVALDSTLRDLYSPECKIDPDSRDSEHYACADPTDPTANVHTNSGVINHLFTLLADGGVHEQDTISGMGLTRAAHLFFYVAEHLMTPVTDFAAFATQLELAATELEGAPLPELTLLDLPATIHPDTIGEEQLLMVRRAVTSLGLAGGADCTLSPTLLPSPPGTCAHARQPEFIALMRQDWEAADNDWLTQEQATNPITWRPKRWSASDRLPDGRAGRAAFVPTPWDPDCAAADQAGSSSLLSPVVELPPDETEFVLAFDHYYALRPNVDGGVLSIARNGGNFLPVRNAAFLHNGYDDFLDASAAHPLAGRLAFSGSDPGSTSGSWGRSLVDLTAAGCRPGDRIQVRWTLGQDGCAGYRGWYVDEVSIGFCTEAVLPVEWQSFTATPRKEAVDLRWVTAAETNHAGFTIERRGNTGRFAAIGFVSAGNDHVYRDEAVRPGATYHYRLRQEDLDGSFDYSAVVSATLPHPELLVYPNPAVTSFRVVRAGAGPVTVYDASGRRWLSVSPVGEEVIISTEGLPPGVYLVRSGSATGRIVVH